MERTDCFLFLQGNERNKPPSSLEWVFPCDKAKQDGMNIRTNDDRERGAL